MTKIIEESLGCGLDLLQPSDTPIDFLAAILRVAKLQVIVERLQDELLKPKRHNRQLGDELVRHENMLRRAKEELAALIPEPLSWWERRQREREQEEPANGEES